MVQFEIGPVGQQADATVRRGNRAGGLSNQGGGSGGDGHAGFGETVRPPPASDTAMDTPGSQLPERTVEAEQDEGHEGNDGAPLGRHGENLH